MARKYLGTTPSGSTDLVVKSFADGSSETLTNKNLTSGTNTFPTFNQNTTGSAATLTTSRNIDGQPFNGSADITVIAPGTHAATSKTPPVDADELPLVDSAASNVLKKLTWANLKATIKTYYDSVSSALTNKDLTSGTNTFPTFNQNTTGTAAAITGKTTPSGALVGTTDTQTLTNKIVSDTFLGRALDTVAIQESVTLLASNEFLVLGTLEIASGLSLEIPSTSTLEVVPGYSKALSNPQVSGYTETQLNIGTVTTACTLNISAATALMATLTASTACIFIMPPIVAGQSFVLYLTQAAGGSGTATFPGVLWSAGTAPTMSATANYVDIFTFFNNGTTWFGSYSQAYH